MRRWVLAEPTVVIISQYISVETVMLYALNLYSDVCQLFPNKAGKVINFKIKKQQKIMLRFDRKQQNSVKQLSFNKKNMLIFKNRSYWSHLDQPHEKPSGFRGSSFKHQPPLPTFQCFLSSCVQDSKPLKRYTEVLLI